MDHRIFYLITKTENAMSVYIRQQFSKAGLKVTPAQLAILFLLRKKNPQTMSELSQELESDNSAVTRAIDRMEKSGLVVRNNSPKDRREYHVTITEAGVNESEKVKKVIFSINKKIENEFATSELDVFKATLQKMYSLFKG